MHGWLDYQNIAQLKALHRHHTAILRAMEARQYPRNLNIQLFAEQHEYATQEQALFVEEIAKRIRRLEGLADEMKR